MSLNPIRHLDIFNPLLYENKQVHIFGTNLVARTIAYLVAKLGVDNIHFHSFTQDGEHAHAIAKFVDEMAQINACVHLHEGAVADVACDDVVFVAEEIAVRPGIYQNVLEVSMSTEVIFDVRINDAQLPIIHTLKPEELFTHAMLYETQNVAWERAVSNPIEASLLAVWTVNQFITWTQQTFQMEGKQDRVVQSVQVISPTSSRLKVPSVYHAPDSRFDLLKKQSVTVIGVGATGSNLVSLLASCGFEDITVYDFDVIESHNIANQWFRQDQIGLLKVEALYKNIDVYHGRRIIARNEKAQEGQPMGRIVFLLTDSMTSRKMIGENLVKDNAEVEILIETRMGAELMQLYVADKTQPEAYEQWANTLFDESQAQPEVSSCGTSITVGTTAMLCATYAVNQLFHVEVARQAKQDMGFHAVHADMYPPYAIIK